MTRADVDQDALVLRKPIMIGQVGALVEEWQGKHRHAGQDVVFSPASEKSRA
jgi:hypothetical protein